MQTDLDDVESAIRSLAPLVVLHSRSSGPMPRELKNFNLVEEGKKWLYFYLVQPDKINEVVMIHVPEQGYWSIDVHRSPVVQMNLCFFNGQILRRGRVYYVDKFYGPDNELVSKSVSFQQWAKSILVTVKKGLKKSGTDYIGQDAENWLLTNGGELAQ